MHMYMYTYRKHLSGYFQLLVLGQEDGYCTGSEEGKLKLPLSVLREWNQQFPEYLSAEPLFFRPENTGVI